ncbi:MULTISPECIES: helix-turn-helix domain-containing protein [Pseudomonas]|uniref:helix-turn-helix domain-containing protein n=1 Tax=Pseudomonas TaxID=286 RepID=UPI001CBE3846|nr:MULTISPECIES: helix-turn-helix transcriptional regulator [Pseudomonas]MCY4123759.1 helix-turn-helix domain-containing protein [Pseudomonas sp.]MCK2111378.1 helix-turn-helix domain-containing protein [Pseudomonas juntendi]MCK2115415.1 helix-turn-helix domain-containing protein [Pseudomonas juntendi]MCT5776077.1 helix-turn-helix domain-containing protein [Pseudomonas aeruginosa]MDG4456423.1 helix-turn-helix domain-containing protein [Pseudomonas aeruginosa]
MEVGLAFGKVLRRRRVEAGLTQEQLAHEAELQRNYVSLMERGINQPTITTLIKLANPLGCTAAEIVAEVEQLVVPARDMSQKPSVQHRQVTPSARVFHQQDRSQGTFQGEAIQEGPLRDRCFTKKTGKLP